MKKKWSKTSIAKAKATREANRLAKMDAIHEVMARVKSAVTYLQQAENLMVKPYTVAELHAQLALKKLTEK